MPRIARVSLTAAATVAALLAGSSALAVAAPSKPKASFTFTPAKPVVGDKLVLDARATKCSAKPCKYLWTSRAGRAKAVKLGSKSKSTLVLKRAETLAVTLKVTDKRRRSASKKRTIVIAAASLPAPPFQPALPSSPLIISPAPAPAESPTPTATATATPTRTPTPTPDTTAPETAIDGGPKGLTNVAQATYSFSSEAGAVFECKLDGAQFAACTSPLTLKLADGAHTFAVRARDAAGNVDATPATRTHTVDTGAPETTIDSGPSGTTGDNTPTYEFSSEAGATFECAIGNAPYAACTSPYTAELGDGAHIFTVRARDAAGNTDLTPATRTLTVDTVAPEVKIDYAPAGMVLDTSVTFGFSSPEEGVRFECKLEKNEAGGEFKPCASPWVVADLTDGERTFSVRAVDAVNNAGDVKTRTFAVVNPPPGAAVFVASEGDDEGDCSSAKPCRTFARAYSMAPDGGLLLVRPGGYGDQVLPEGSKQLSVRATDENRPTVRYLTARADDVRVNGIKIEKLTIYGSRQTYDDVHVDGRFLRHPGIEHLRGDDNTFKNGRVGNITDEKGALIGPNRFTFDNVVFHDVLVTDEAVHNECLYATGAEGLTVRRSTFHACATMDLFVTNFEGGPDFGRLTIENNIFEHSTMEAADSWHFYSVGIHPVVGALRGWVVRNNTFEIGVTIGPEIGSGRWVGNLGDWDCVPGVTYRYNVGQDCGELDSGVFPAASTKQKPAAFGWLNPAALDFRLIATSPAVDNADPEDFPETDRNGAPRPNGFGPDAGALERVG